MDAVPGPEDNRAVTWVHRDDPGASRHAAVCEYFVRCERPAEGLVVHPVAGVVPTCTRCADLVGAQLQDFGADRLTA